MTQTQNPVLISATLVASQQPECITNDGLLNLYIIFMFVGIMACASIGTRIKNQYEKSMLAQTDRKQLNSYICSLVRNWSEFFVKAYEHNE